MKKFRIVESAVDGIERVHTFDDLEIHHPSKNVRGLRTGRASDFQSGRAHERVEGDFEEIRRTPDGRTLVKKDFILLDDSSAPTHLPSPVAGFVHYRHDKTATVQVFDRPQGEAGAKLLGQVLHMDPRTFNIPEGGAVAYGQPLGLMSDTGSRGAVHAHVEAEVAQFRRYIHDINNGTIAPGCWPGREHKAVHAPAPQSALSHPTTPAMAAARPGADGVLESGDRGPEVRALQAALNRLGVRDAQGLPLVEDGGFGARTRDAVELFQREHGLHVDGRGGRDTRDALNAPHGARVTHPTHPDYQLFENLLGRVQAAEAERGLPSGPHSMNIAAALLVQMRHDGIERADRVELNDTSRLVRVVQTSPTGWHEHELATSPIDTRQASTQSIHESSDQLAAFKSEPARSVGGHAPVQRHSPAMSP